MLLSFLLISYLETELTTAQNFKCYIHHNFYVYWSLKTNKAHNRTGDHECLESHKSSTKISYKKKYNSISKKANVLENRAKTFKFYRLWSSHFLSHSYECAIIYLGFYILSSVSKAISIWKIDDLSRTPRIHRYSLVHGPYNWLLH